LRSAENRLEEKS